MEIKNKSISIKNIEYILKLKLEIPKYQRPYKWSKKNIYELLTDINNAITEESFYGEEFTYRIGTIILHKKIDDKQEECYDIVDGQQRIISLILLRKYLDGSYKCPLLEGKFTNKVTIKNINENYQFINDWFKYKKDEKQKFIKAYKRLLELVIIIVDDVSEAFQLFDSQNNRGKALDPHDLLKAYHLREMKDSPYDMERAVKKWENKKAEQIRGLFNCNLFRIFNWSKGIKAKEFTVNEIDTYKGIQINSSYSYAKRASKASPYFQITEPFIAGNDFFEMVDYYLYLLDVIKKELNKDKYQKLKEILGNKKYESSSGFKYTRDLFYCAILAYYDKFHNFDEVVVKKLFIWAFMLRIDMRNLGFDSVNKYAIGGEENNIYTNKIPIFTKIQYARLHTEIENIQIQVIKTNNKNDKWNNLYEKLKEINK